MPRFLRRPLLLVTALVTAVLPLVQSPRTAHAAVNLPAAWGATIGMGAGSATPAIQPFSTPAIGDLFGDGNREVVAGFPDGSVWAWYASSGSLVPGWPQHTGGSLGASPALADLYGDGRQEVVVPSLSGNVFAWDGHGNVLPGWPQHSQPPGPGLLSQFFSSAAIGDLFGDGQMEIAVAGYDEMLYVWHVDGSLVPGFPRWLYDTVWDTPTLADLEHSGMLDVLSGADSGGGPTEPCPPGASYWAFRPDGSRMWLNCGVGNQVPWASTAVTDLHRGQGEQIVYGSGHYFPAPAGRYVGVLNANGSGAWQNPTGAPNFGSPAVGDLYGTGEREVVETSEDGLVYGWNADGYPLPRFPINPGQGQLLTSPVIAPVDGSGRNGLWVSTGWGSLLGYSFSGNGSPPTLAVDIPGLGPIWSAPTVAAVGGQLVVAVTSMANASNTGWTIHVYPIPGTGAGMPTGAWPTFHGNMRRSGTEVPTAHVNPLASSQLSAAFNVSWALDAGSAATTNYAVFVRNGSGPWVRWLTTTYSSATFHGRPGQAYSFYVEAAPSGNLPGPATAAQTSTTVSGLPLNQEPFGGMYMADEFGRVYGASSPPMATSGTWPGWNIVRGEIVFSGGYGGYTLDAWGALHPFGYAASAAGGPYWPGWDIARGVATEATLTLSASPPGYVLDGWGGLHPFNGAPAPSGGPYWPGFDIGRGLGVCPSGQGFVLDGWGGVHPFNGAPAVRMSGYWPGWDIARGIAVESSCRGGYVLDGWGGLHAFGDAPAAGTGAYWPGWDIARGVTLIPGTDQGYVVDGFGGIHPFGGAPGVDSYTYLAGQDVVRGISAG